VEEYSTALAMLSEQTD